jgi:hypothetical protein
MKDINEQVAKNLLYYPLLFTLVHEHSPQPQ